MKKIALIITTKGIGGAGTRFIRFFAHIQKNGIAKKHNIFLYLNASLAQEIKKSNLINLSDENLIILNDLEKNGIKYKIFFLSLISYFYRDSKDYSSVHLVSGSIFFVIFFRIFNILKLRKIKVISFDSAISPNGRILHIAPADTKYVAEQELDLILDALGSNVNEIAILSETPQSSNQNEWIAEMTALLEEAGSQGLNFVSGEGDGNEETGNVVKGFTIDFAVCFGLEGMNNGFSFSFLTDGDDYGITFTQLRNGEGYEVTLIGLSGTYMEKMDGSDMTIEDSYGPGQTWSGGFLPFSLSVSGNNYGS